LDASRFPTFFGLMTITITIITIVNITITMPLTITITPPSQYMCRPG
jgi:hypothetical protein